MPQETFAGTSTYWREWGNGPRQALMVHCSLAQSAAWAGVAEDLSDGMHLKAFDLPGHGQSGDWETERDFADQAVDMALGLIGNDPVDLIGHSFGAVLCLRLALEYPELVRTLSLYEPVFFAAAQEKGYDVDALFTNFSKAIGENDLENATRHFMSLWGSGEKWETIPDRQREALVRRIHLIPAGVPTLHEDRSGLLKPGRLEGLDIPVLLLEGSKSPPVVNTINAALAERLPKCRRLTIDGADHMGPLTHPRHVAQAIRSGL